jgi:hypothetical protein
MTPKWSQKSIKAGLPNVVIFCSFSKLGQEAAKMGPAWLEMAHRRFQVDAEAAQAGS